MRRIVMLGMAVIHNLTTTLPMELFCKLTWTDTGFIGEHRFREDGDGQIVLFNQLPDIPAGVVPTH